MQSLADLIGFPLWRKLAVVPGRFGGEEFGNGAFREVAAAEDLPFVVEFGQDRGGEPVERRRVGKVPLIAPRCRNSARLRANTSRSRHLGGRIGP
ncbi:hypothetical protein J7I98_31605 [Streptomyces sp. ISL-98]|nr:hypothetical protein [Streptomyces sp. ISL-98]MBT2510321.1 hypothetical protein [Streptomyces sp. ISL-98]